MSNSTLIELGKVVKPHGLKGGVKVELYNIDSTALNDCQQLLCGKQSGNAQTIEITQASKTPKGWLVYFKDIETIEQAEKLRGKTLWIDQSALPPLADGEYYHFQLEGAEVRDHQDQLVGNVVSLEAGPSCDYLVVAAGDKQLTIPMIDDAILEFNIEAQWIRLKPMDGLLDDAD